MIKNMNTDKSLLQIVMTPVRNEAWVLRAFLETTSLWADYIIIADQMSTDGSREIAKEYPKVILIDNKNPEFNEAERQAMLITKAREVAAGRDTLLWGLDADEVLAANTFETDDWKRILNSKPGDVFCFKWAVIDSNRNKYWHSTHFPWLFHDDGKEEHGNYVRSIHSMRIPYPIEERQLFYVNDFFVLHLDHLNVYRRASKNRFYQFVDWELNMRSPIKLSRLYMSDQKRFVTYYSINDELVYKKDRYDFDLFELVDAELKTNWMDEYIIDRLSRHAKKDVRRLDIWQKTFIKTYNLTDPRRMIDKVIHKYLLKTSSIKDTKIIRAIDFLLIKLY